MGPMRDECGALVASQPEHLANVLVVYRGPDFR